MSNIKIANTQHAVHDLIKNRWSPRSFSDKTISNDDLLTLVEAATWSYSANNEQPWRYIVGAKGSDVYNKILETIMPGNMPWAKNAAAFVVAIAKTNFDKEGNPTNNNAELDLGSANMAMTLQALTMDIYMHPMGGFDRAKMKETFELGTFLKPMVVFAVGYLGEAEQLEEPYLSRELTPRTRKSLEDIVLY